MANADTVIVYSHPLAKNAMHSPAAGAIFLVYGIKRKGDKIGMG